VLEGKKVAILVEDDFEDTELTEALRSMKGAGARVVIVGSGSKDTYRGKRGVVKVNIDIEADKVDAADFDAVIIPGGDAPEKMSRHPEMVALVRRLHEAGRVVAAICHGPRLLISAGIAKGRRLTSCSPLTVELEKAGAEWVDMPVVVDGNVVTSRKPADLPRFNRAIIELLRDRW
jgi:protease I